MSDAVVQKTVLSARARAAVRAFADAVFAGPDAGPDPARLDWLVGDFDDFLARAGSRARLVLRLALFAVSAIAPFYARRAPPLRALPHPTRVRALARMEEGFASGAVLALKAALCILYYEHPDAARDVGFVGTGARRALPASSLVGRQPRA